jgi:hypothetical protein
MDGHIRSGFEAQPDAAAVNRENRDFKDALEAVGPSDHYRLLGFPR